MIVSRSTRRSKRKFVLACRSVLILLVSNIESQVVARRTTRDVRKLFVLEQKPQQERHTFYSIEEFFASIVKLGLRFDPAIEGFGSGKQFTSQFVQIELVLYIKLLVCTGASSSFHVIFEFGLDAPQFLRDLFSLKNGYGCSMGIGECYRVPVCRGVPVTPLIRSFSSLLALPAGQY
jgi:hypothetical protein